MTGSYEKALEGLTSLEMTFQGETRKVYKAGEGPAIIVIHEIPGLHPGVIDFGWRLVREGFTVWMPSLLGTPGKPVSGGYTLSSVTKACVSREFTTFATGKNSPVVDWLRELARHAFEECGGPGTGVVGMCLTGGFALGMMVDEHVLAPVLSQPSLPFNILPSQKRDLGVDEPTLERIKERTEDGICVLGLRFTHDAMMPGQRFARLREELGDNFIGVEIPSGPGNKHGIPISAHSVLTRDLVDQPGHPTQDTLHQVLDFFKERLQPTSA